MIDFSHGLPTWFPTLMSYAFIAWVGWGLRSRQAADANQMTAEAYKGLYEAQLKENDQLKKSFGSVKSALAWQDRRIQRLELHEESKKRQHEASERIVEMYEDVLAMALPCVVEHDIRTRINSKLAEIRATRNKAAREIEEWLASREALLAYTGEDADKAFDITAYLSQVEEEKGK